MNRSAPVASSATVDWRAVVSGLESGDPTSLMHVSRLITRSLVRLRAYDFRDEWPDLTQEVLVAVVEAVRKRRLREPDALPAYVASITRNHFNDRLKSHLKERSLVWSDAAEPHPASGSAAPCDAELRHDVRVALERLSEPKRRAILDVYVRGMSYREAAEGAGVPLGTLKDALKHGLAELRRRIRRHGS